ncbi:MAG: hypothetical protein LKK13_03770 [Bacilli bacterium]|jgi:hypothetical protein|nr:hypothetical protein [Bacilli bacterium]
MVAFAPQLCVYGENLPFRNGDVIYGTYWSAAYYAPLLYFDWPISLIIIGLYGLVFILASFVPLAIASHVNISEVLVEER